jgi:hypothetical protein
MGAITGTKVLGTEFSGEWKLLIIDIVPASASDTVTLTAATHGITEIIAVNVQLKTGFDAALQTIWATFSGLVITVISETSAGGVATDWTSATAQLWVIGR